MDSGNITFADLGINSKFAKALSVRRRSTCAPLDAKRFLTPLPPDVLAANALVNATAYNFLEESNGTPFAVQYLRHPDVSVDYDLQAYEFGEVPPDSEFEAAGVGLVAPLKKAQNDHSVSLILLSGTGILFLSPNDDPLFSANREVRSVVTNIPRYKTDNNVNMLGCDERAQLCSSLTGKCTTWGGPPVVFPDDFSVLGGDITGGDALDIVRSTTLIQLLLPTTLLPQSIGGRTAASALQAGRYLQSGWQVRIEPEQWKRKLEYWSAVGLARLQLEVFGTVERPLGVDPSLAVNQWEKDQYKALKALCGGIKFKSPGHTSLSALGFGLILGLSGLLVLLSFADVVVPWLLRKRGYEFREWEQTDMLTLMEMTLEVETAAADPFLVLGPEKGNMSS